MDENDSPEWNDILRAVLRLLWAIRDGSKGGLMLAVAELEDYVQRFPRTYKAVCDVLNAIEELSRDEEHR